MKTKERHHLKENELGRLARQARETVETRRSETTDPRRGRRRRRRAGHRVLRLARARADQGARAARPGHGGAGRARRPAAGAGHSGWRPVFSDRARTFAGGADQVQDRRRRLSVDRCRHLRALSGRRDLAGARQHPGRDHGVRTGDQGVGRRLLRPDGASRTRRSAGRAPVSTTRRSRPSRISRSARTVRSRSTAS